MTAQAAHSVEEYVGRLWEVLALAGFFAGSIAEDPETGFVVGNSIFVAFGFWCFLWPVRRRWLSRPVFAWIWVVVELLNGILHPALSVSRGEYLPGTATAPVLFVLAAYLAWQLVGARAGTASRGG